MGTFTNSEVPDEMPPNKVAFHQGQHCLLRYNNLKAKEYNIF